MVGDKDVVEDVFVDSVQNSLETIYYISNPGEERTVMKAIIRYNSYRPECDIIVSKKGSDKTFEYNIVQTDEDGVFTAFLNEDDDIQFLDIPYEEIDGQYVSNGKSYKYKLTLTGKDQTAVKESTFVVLTNDKNVTWKQVHWSLISSNSNDWLEDTVIIGMK